jgi:hypothetical protein
MRVLLFLLLLVPEIAAAKVFMCVDEVTGKTSFTDRGCETTSAREEVRIPPANANSGSRGEELEEPPEQTWVSDRDTRKTARDYSAARRSIASNGGGDGI